MPGPRAAGPSRRPRPAAASPTATAPSAFPGAQLREVAVDDVVPNPKQPRQVFDDEALEELTHSVKEFGLLQPIVVREKPARDGRATSSSWASAGCGPPAPPDWTTVPAIVRDTTDDALLRDALLENIHRVQLNPLEEAAAYQQLLEEFGATHEELASKIGRSRSQVTNTIRLMKLPVKVQTRVAAGVISAGHARALLGLPDAEAQDALATRIVAEGMSVRATEEAVAMAAAERPTAKRRARNITAPGVEELGSRLSDRFETKVKIQIGRAKGRSSSSSARSTTCSASSASWPRRSPDAVRRPDHRPTHGQRPRFRHMTEPGRRARGGCGVSGSRPARRASSRARTSPSS